ncbi:gasdermin-E [Ambystoma mexicanum]|uniref:gasdermin-E n=1 Tax=Ambystoma mexicanum TaxID=8296 RepID=UPI0037E8936B
MFAKATKNFLKEIDSGGDLISVSSLNDSDKLQLLCAVTKRKRFWCWQKPKYHPSSFTLSDLLTEAIPLEPVVVESDFVKYDGKFGNCIGGNIGTEVGVLELSSAGKGCVESHTSFGSLRKREVDINQLMKDVHQRKVNWKQPLLQQMLERKNEVLCILKEKIITTQECVISEHTQMEAKHGGNIEIKTKIVKVSVNENGNLSKDANVVLEIPPSTAIAYGIIELYIKRDGHLEFCVLPEREGGFERESTEGVYPHISAHFETFALHSWDCVDGNRHAAKRKSIQGGAPISILKEDISQLRKHFECFANLQDDKRTLLYQMFCEVLYHGATVTLLENVMDDICAGVSVIDMDLRELESVQRHKVTEFLHFFGCRVENEMLLQQIDIHSEELFAAAHFLISALDELSDSTLALLGACCDLQVVSTLCCWLDSTSEEGTSSLSDPMLGPFSDQGRFLVVERMLSLSNITLEKTGCSLKAVTKREPGFLPLILFIALSGFHALSGGF